MKLKADIRLAAAEDAELLARLGRETFYDAFANHPLMTKPDLDLYLNEAFTVSQITSELNDPQTTFLVAELNGQSIGYAKLIPESLEKGIMGKNPVKLKRLYARQEFLGVGIGAGLLSHCLEQAGTSGYDTLWLTVWEHNRRAQEFYRKWDFKPCGVIDFQFGNRMLADILMHRSL